uniref:Uncharacterized protein n=1 Tax=Sphaerodactylus townsendi TaxID=933632 RepID=A0ACB8FIC9_9SAUR
MASPAELSSSVERLRQRYLLGQDYSSKTVQTKYKNRRDLVSPGKMDSSLDDTFSSLLINSSCPEHPYSGRKHNRKYYSDSSKKFINMGWLDEELDSQIDSSQFNIQPESIKDLLESNEGQRTGIHTETGFCYKKMNGNSKIPEQPIAKLNNVTLPSGLVVATCSDCDGSGVVRETGSQALKGKSLVPSHFSQIYHELSIIYQKLQQENLIQQENSLKLEQRERLLMEREALLCKHEAALTKIRGVEEKVHAKFQIIKEQHEAEIQQLSEALKEKTKENKRLRSSFDTLKELNDTLKKQLSDVSEQNKKIEAQSRKVQARLENLQRKHEFLTVQKSKETSYAAQEHKPIKQEKLTAISKTCKVPLNLHIYDLLTVLLDWISDQHLRKLMHDDEKENIHKPTGTLSFNRSYTQEKCVKHNPDCCGKQRLSRGAARKKEAKTLPVGPSRLTPSKRVVQGQGHSTTGSKLGVKAN